MIDVAKLKEWASVFEAADTDYAIEASDGGQGWKGAQRMADLMKSSALQVRDEIANIEREGSLQKRHAEAISHNIELRAGLERIKQAAIDQRWILDLRAAGSSNLVLLHEFCSQLLNRKPTP